MLEDNEGQHYDFVILSEPEKHFGAHLEKVTLSLGKLSKITEGGGAHPHSAKLFWAE